MTLEILTPERKLFSGEVYGVQMPGISGSFEVLDKHAPLVSALKLAALKYCAISKITQLLMISRAGLLKC
jgi:F0F1-type ATP synthase epsilon subunit